MEETGIDTSELKPELLFTDGVGVSEKTLSNGEVVLCEMTFHEYRINLPNAATEYELQPMDDLTELQWVPMSAISTLKLTPPGEAMFQKLGML